MLAPARLDWVVRMRALAALGVVAYHVWSVWGGDNFRFGMPGLAGDVVRALMRAGIRGVDLFFVLSGFVIAWPYLLERRQKLSTTEVLDFYRRRYLRIAPVFYLSIAVAVLLASRGLLRASTDPFVVLCHLFFAENFNEDMVVAIRGVYWTLPTEIYYYVLFPFLLRWLPLDRPGRIAALAIAFAVAYRVFVWWMSTREEVWLLWAEAFLPGRIDQFLLGLVAACAVVSRPPQRRLPALFVPVMLALVLALAVFIARDRARFTWVYFIGPSLLGAAIAALLFGLGARLAEPRPLPAVVRLMPGSNLLYAIGAASFSLYIWHTFFIDVANNILPAAPAYDPARNSRLAIAALASIPFSMLTYRFVEKPFVAFSKRRGKKKGRPEPPFTGSD